MLITHSNVAGRPLMEYDGALYVARWLESVFTYAEDMPRADGRSDRWPTRAEVEAQIHGTGRLIDDCDGHAFAAVYALADLGIKARVVLGWTEPPGNVYHAICETAGGWVIDNRHPGQVLTWDSPQINRYVRDAMSGFFEFGEVAQWWRPARAEAT